MRIISGKFKGKNILIPKDKFTRPLRDMVKESIFNILKHSKLFSCKIEKGDILDLFSGTGSFGLECISRGASRITFIENYKPAISVLKKNIDNLNCASITKIIDKDISAFKFSGLDKFDVIFLDPPFKYKNIDNLIISLRNLNLLKKNGLIVLHRHRNDKEILTPEFKILKKQNYGISNVFFGY